LLEQGKPVSKLRLMGVKPILTLSCRSILCGLWPPNPTGFVTT